MDTSETTTKRSSNGLWIPSLIIGVSFILSMVFVVKSLKGYKQPQPLLIRPSSVEKPEEITTALYRALYPLKQRGFGVKISSLDDDPIAHQVATSLIKMFPEDKSSFSFNAYKVSITDEHDTEKTDCRNTALFNLKRKPERNWKKEIYFTVCTEKKEAFSLFYTTK